MTFVVTKKVAIITGGASGLGFECAKELLNNNAKGVTIADIDDVKGKESAEELNKIFGAGKAIFVHVDTTNKDEFENAFKFTLDRFGHVDILVNNAAILNEVDWRQCFNVHINGYVNGIILGMENYLKNHRIDDQAVILNTCSIAAFGILPHYPIYSTSKFAVMGMTKTWGHEAHYQRTKVRVLAVCPGCTRTPLVAKATPSNFLMKDYGSMNDQFDSFHFQSAEHVGKEMVNLIKNGKCGSLNVVEDDLPYYEYVLPQKEEFKKI